MKILYAEDERALSDAVTAVLIHTGYEVDAVYDGAEALDYINKNDYDGIILDIMMPKVSGTEVLSYVREQEIMTPVMMLTAKAETIDKVQGLELGADDYLAKPFAMAEFIARVKALTRRNREKDNDIKAIIAGNITLSKTTFELGNDKGQIRLSKKEYQLIDMFMSNKNKVLDQKQILDRIWAGEDEEVNIVWIYVSYLRKKLEALGANITINDIKDNGKRGYMLEVI